VSSSYEYEVGVSSLVARFDALSVFGRRPLRSSLVVFVRCPVGRVDPLLSFYNSRHIRFNGCLGSFLGRNLVTNGFLSGYMGLFPAGKWPERARVTI
jgi:hypothetical protein